MTTIIAVSGVSTWVLLVGAGLAGLVFGMLLNSIIGGRRRK